VLNYPVDRVQESLRTLAVGATGGSPVLALKRCHSNRKRSPNKVKRTTTAMATTKMMKVDAAVPVRQEQQPHITASAAAVVELEDLGADYLEELLRVSSDEHSSASATTVGQLDLQSLIANTAPILFPRC
jgi:hypothetical protein